MEDANGVAECPVIHKVTEANSGAKCPVQPNDAPKKEKPEVKGVYEDMEDDENVDPNLREYRKLKRVMGMITKFYENGTSLKKGHHDDACAELEKLDFDQTMAKEQLAAIEKVPLYQRHPKLKTYSEYLNSEISARSKEREPIEAKRVEFLELSKWSAVIVKICQWLDLHMDAYAHDEMGLSQVKKPENIKVLNDEEKQQYAKGLAEITYNLQESQDFFQASVDGRLKKYHGVERKMILSQLEVIRQYPEESPRRQHIEEELMKDLEYVEGNMTDDEKGMKRKQQMLDNHKEFLKVLKFYRDRLNLIPKQEMVYDPKYDHYNDQ